MYKITKWTKEITEDHKDLVVCKKPKDLDYKFRLLDDDGYVYGYGYSDDDSSFAPLDHYQPLYGVTAIQYKNSLTGEYEYL